MEEPVNPAKSFTELYTLYVKTKSELFEKKNNTDNIKDDGDKASKFQFKPVTVYIDEWLQTEIKDTETYIQLLAMKASLYYEQVKMSIRKRILTKPYETIKEAIDMIEKYKTNPLITYLYLRLINYYAYLLSKDDLLDQARKVLEESEIIVKLIPSKENIFLYTTDELFKHHDHLRTNQNSLQFEKLRTNNFQMLGWIYNRLNMIDKFIVYHHMVLRRQLEMEDGNAFTWVYKCARLASYFFGRYKFKEARHQLAAAYAVLREYEKDLLKYRVGIEPTLLPEWEDLQHYYADLGRYWVKYGLLLFVASNENHAKLDMGIDRMLIESFDKPKSQITDEKGDNVEKKESGLSLSPSLAHLSLNKDTKNHDNDKYEFVYPSLQTQDIEMEVTASFIKTAEQARALFLFIQEWAKRSKAYYTVQQYTEEYVNIILEINELYRQLANYEIDLDNQYNVQKRRADLLETLIGILRDIKPQFYYTVSVQLLRELTEVQIDLISLNMQRLYNGSEDATPQEAQVRMHAMADVHSHLERISSF